MNPLLLLSEAGQSVWLDAIRRNLLTTGELRQMIDQDGLKGLTSNPAIFEKAIVSGTEYDESLKRLLNERDRDAKELYEELAIEDIQGAADTLRPVYESTQRLDGYVSLEVSPELARDAVGTLEEARRLWAAVDRENLMIKVPGTVECLPVIADLIAEGVNVNITLLFSRNRYREVAEAYMRGLERRLDAGHRDLSTISSVASFFVSRIDTLVDSLIDDQIRSASDPSALEDLRAIQGKVAIANAKLAYRIYRELLSDSRWSRLADLGARPQRLLWASTSTKNKKYRDVMYLEELVGPETVTTVPQQTFDAFRDHGRVKLTLSDGVDEAQRVLETLERHRISLEQVTEILEKNAIELFSDPFQNLLSELERKRRECFGNRLNGASYSVPSEMSMIIDRHLKEGSAQHLCERIWARDSTVWTGGDEGKWLGWLEAPGQSRIRAEEWVRFAEEIRSEGYESCVLLGMGGSSLAPDVFSKLFPVKDGYPKLSILDSTDPLRVQAVEDRIGLEKTLFIVSSKSGGTLEPNALFEYFWGRLKAAFGSAHESDVGRNFVAITDPGSSLEKLAREKGFRAVFQGEPSIGGRYSALSVFGLLPAAIAGVDIRGLLDRTLLMLTSCGPETPFKESPGAELGVLLGVLANHGRDKLTLISDESYLPLQGWIEQLVAESTGKQGKAIIPIAGESASSIEAYGSDRVFVHLRGPKSGAAGSMEEFAVRLQNSGQPVIRIQMRDPLNLGQEFFRWEFATAVAGSILGIDPFDQPDVEAAKAATREIMSRAQEPPIRSDRDGEEATLKFTAGSGVDSPSNSKMIERFRALFSSLAPGDYFAILAYVPDEPVYVEALQDLRCLVRDHQRVASLLQFGPRYLHSTGQAFKGGPNSGVFLEIVSSNGIDLAVPGKTYTFGAIKRAQAEGDLKVLRERDRRCLSLSISGNLEQSLREIHHLFRHALQGVVPLNNQVNTEGLNREWAESRKNHRNQEAV